VDIKNNIGVEESCDLTVINEDYIVTLHNGMDTIKKCFIYARTIIWHAALSVNVYITGCSDLRMLRLRFLLVYSYFDQPCHLSWQ
jgi:hypothetical protein